MVSVSKNLTLVMALALETTTGCKWTKRPAQRGETPDASALDASTLTRREITIGPGNNGWILTATLSAGAPSTQGAGVLLVHQFGSDRSEWRELVERLGRWPAVTVLAVDLRGHGGSTNGPSGRRTWEDFRSTPEVWAESHKDVQTAMTYLDTLESVRRLVIVGAGFGATVSVLAAHRTSVARMQVAGMVMISPGLTDRGVAVLPEFEPLIAGVNAGAAPRVLFLGADQDQSAVEAVPLLLSRAGRWGEGEVIGASRAHGVALLDEDPRRWNRVEAFIRDVLGAQRTGLERTVVTDAGAQDGSNGSNGSDGGGFTDRQGHEER